MSFEGALRDRLDPADQLIETFRFEPATGFVRLAQHLGRLERSAGCLGFRFERERIDALLAELPRNEGDLRVRLTLDADGNPDLTTQSFVSLPADAIWTLQFAETRVDAKDGLLAHKTTRREIYDRARAEYPAAQVQEVLLCNRDGLVCEGTFTNLFVARPDGFLVTPPLSCGLLPGILRESLLNDGRATEEVLHPEDLIDQRLFVGNSLRGLIPARLASAST